MNSRNWAFICCGILLLVLFLSCVSGPAARDEEVSGSIAKELKFNSSDSSRATGVPGPRSGTDNTAIRKFRTRAKEVLEALPSVQDIRKSTDDFHYTPPLLVDRSAELGDIRDALEKDPSLIPVGLDFYRKCARRGDLMDSTRALCLRNLKDWARKSGLSPDIAAGEIPENIVRVSDRLPAE